MQKVVRGATITIMVFLALIIAASFFWWKSLNSNDDRAVAARTKVAPVTKSYQNENKKAPKSAEPICAPHTYYVVEGDSLSRIAGREWGGRAYFWPVLWEVNPKITNPNLIFVGQALTIPCLCDLPALATKKLVAKKKVAPKSKKAIRTVAARPVCPECPAVEPAKPVAPAPAPPVKASQPEAPKPPPASIAAPAAPQTQTQSQSQTVIVNPPTAAAPAPVPPQPSAPVPSPAAAPPVVKKEVVVVPPPPVVRPSNKQFVWSLWNTIGQNPIEPGDTVDMFHVDAGVVLGKIWKFQVEPYIAINGVKDTKGYSWNNRAKGEAGLKLVLPIPYGVVEFGTGYAAERRFGAGLPAQTKMGTINFMDWWVGRDQPTRQAAKRKFLTGAFPGTFQGVIGNVSPFERNNLIGWIRADQGFTLAKFKGISLIPTATSLLTFDTNKYPWNNRYTYGGGLKVAFPRGSGVFDLQGGYQCAKQYAGPMMAGGSRCGPGFSVNLWTGGRHKLGGG